MVRQGISPHQLALSITLGFFLGIIPVFGFITPLCAGLALWFRLNVPLALSVLYIVLPLQLALFIPFLRWGENIFHLSRIPIAPEKLLNMVQTSWWGTLEQLGLSLLTAVAIWFAVSVPGSFLFYFLFSRILKKVQKKQRSQF